LIRYDQQAKQQSEKAVLATNTKAALQNPKGRPAGHILQWKITLASSA